MKQDFWQRNINSILIWSFFTIWACWLGCTGEPIKTPWSWYACWFAIVGAYIVKMDEAVYKLQTKLEETQTKLREANRKLNDQKR